MPYVKRTRRRKPTNGQLDLLGGVYGFNLVYQPQVSHRKGEPYQVVTRIPEDKVNDRLYQATAIKAAKALLETVHQPTVNYWKNHKYIDE